MRAYIDLMEGMTVKASQGRYDGDHEAAKTLAREWVAVEAAMKNEIDPLKMAELRDRKAAISAQVRQTNVPDWLVYILAAKQGKI